MPYVPDDPLYATTFHFTALGMRGATRGIEIVWEDYRGRGITIDTHETVESNHPDLDDQFSPLPPVDLNSHGTGVAGIIAAENNGLGGVGVAFGATLRANQPWHESMVQNGSWVFGRDYTAFQTGIAGTDWETMVLAGRAGLGTPFAKSAGNDTVIGAAEGLNSSRVTATIAAVDIGGFRAGYSNYGSSILVSASDNGATTGLSGEGPDNPPGDFVNGFGGTSHASPVTAGVMALMMEANPNLGWRDFYDILAQAAVRTGSTFGAGASMTEIQGWDFNRAATWNGGAYHISADYGYGMVDVLNAVRLAEAQALIGQAAQTSGNEQMATSGTVATPLNFTGDNSFTVAISGADIEIDHVAVTLNVTEADFRDLKFWLNSPSGTTILLHDGATGGLAPNEVTIYAGVAAGAGGLTYTWGVEGLRGEMVNGNWTVEVTDASSGNRHIQSVTVDVYGSYASADDVYVYTNEFAELKTLDPSRGTLDDATGDNWFNGAALSGVVNLDMRQSSASTIDANPFISTSATNRLIGAVMGDGGDTVDGNALDNRISGMRGTDLILGREGNDIINGGRDADTLDGGTGIDTVDYKGSDAGVRIDLSAPVIADRARGGHAEGDVLIRLISLPENTFENVSGSAHDDRLAGDFRANSLWGARGDDILNGLDGIDILSGGEGGDGLLGGIGTDTIFGGSGGDTIFGDQAFVGLANGHLFSGEITDNVTRERALNLRGMFAITPDANVTDAVTVPHVSIDGVGTDTVQYFSFFAFAGETGTFDIDAVTGGLDSWIKLYDAAGVEIAQNDDVLFGLPDAGSSGLIDSFLTHNFTSNQLYTIAVGRYVSASFSPVAEGQSFTLHLSLTNPSATVQGAADTLFGGAGSDTLYGGVGDDTIYGDDQLALSAGGNVVRSAGLANTSLDAAISLDGLWSLAANSAIANATTVRHVTVEGAGDGAVQYFAFTVAAADLDNASVFDIDAATFDASLRLYNADGVVLAENDAAAADPGSTGLDPSIAFKFSAAGTYFIAVSQATSANRFGGIGAGGSYQLHVSLADPTLTKTGGADLLKGEAGSDTLHGGAGIDTLDGGTGADTLAGGADGDTYVVDDGGDVMIEAPNAGSDTVQTSLGNFSLFAIANVERIAFTGTGNFVGRGNGLDNRILGGLGNDRFVADQGGADRYFGDTGVSDTMDFRTSALGAVVNLTTGVHGGAAAGDFFSSIEYFYGSNTAGDNITGAQFNDRLDGYGGADILLGAGGTDTLNGGEGNDEISGGSGLDFLKGDAGADDFNYSALSNSGPTSGARDRILDFVAGLDDIDVTSIDAIASTGANDAFTAFIGNAAFSAEGQIRAFQSGANTVIEFNTTGTSGAEMQIQLNNFTAATLSFGDFIA